MSLVELRQVRKSFVDGERATEVLHGIDLTLEVGEFAAIIGPSGSGKSTLLNLLGLLDRPTSGYLAVNGQDIAQLDDEALTRLRGQTLGFVFQFHHLLPALTAVENVMMPLAIQRGRMTPEDRDTAKAMLDAVGLGPRADTLSGKLSGGQQQRVAIARALSGRPALILADEPSGNLDTKSADDVYTLMRNFHQQQHISFLIVTHDLGLAKRCDRVIELVDGAIAKDERRNGG